MTETETTANPLMPAPPPARSIIDRLQPLILVLLLGAVAYWIISDWANFSAALSRFRLAEWWPLALLLPATSLCGAAAWRAMMAGCGYRLPFGAAVRVWVLSQLGQYVPGTVWFAAGRVYLAGRLGVPAGVTAGVTVAEAISYLAVGVALTLGLAPAVGILVQPAPVLIGLAVVSAIAGLYLGVPFLRRRAAMRLRPILARFPDGIPLGSLAGMAGLHLACWVLGSACFAVVAGSAYDVSAPDLLRIGIVNQVASFAGVLAFLLPQGLGARETVMILGLRQVDAMQGATLADLAALALVARVAFTAWDGVLSLAVLAFTRPPPAQTSQSDAPNSPRVTS